MSTSRRRAKRWPGPNHQSPANRGRTRPPPVRSLPECRKSRRHRDGGSAPRAERLARTPDALGSGSRDDAGGNGRAPEAARESAFIHAERNLPALQALQLAACDLRISSRKFSMRSAYSSSNMPASVSIRAPEPRTKSGCPTQSSSLRIEMLIAGCVRKSFFGCPRKALLARHGLKYLQ